MKIYAAGLQSTYEVEHLARIFFKEAQISSVLEHKADYIYARFGTKHFACAIRQNGKCTILRQKKDIFCEEKPYFQVCTLLYQLLHKHTGFTPPWGLLTGIRPVRLIHDMRNRGMADEDIKNRFLNDFHASSDKTKLSFQIANIQTPFMSHNAKRPYSLYISIPFCPSRCSYCSFVSRTTTQSKALIEPYVQLLQRELHDISRLAQEQGLSLQTIYIGGGTPTALSETQLACLMQTVSDYFDVKNVLEYTVEAGRPDCTNFAKLQIIKSYGATRISINPQTMSDEVLHAIGRLHSAQDIKDCFSDARKAGHNNINMDLIAGLPHDTVKGFEKSLNEIIALAPENITVHTLTLKRASNLVIDSSTNIYADAAQMINKCSLLAENEYLPYYLYRQKNTLECLENTGYCKKGYEGLYNIYIMEEVHTILSAGAGASTKLVSPKGKIERIFNYKYPIEYVNNFDTMIKKKKGVVDFYVSYVDT